MVERVQDLSPDEDIKVKEVVFSCPAPNGKQTADTFHSVSVESILAGHDDKVFGVSWCLSNKKLRLLSASLDKTIILWQSDQDADGLWVECIRVGEVGGNTLGFLGCQISSQGQGDQIWLLPNWLFLGSIHNKVFVFFKVIIWLFSTCFWLFLQILIWTPWSR